LGEPSAPLTLEKKMPKKKKKKTMFEAVIKALRKPLKIK